MKTSALLTLFARREPTTDSVWLQHGDKSVTKNDLVLYSDPARLHEKARIPWHQSQARKRKTVMLNCYLWKLCFA